MCPEEGEEEERVLPVQARAQQYCVYNYSALQLLSCRGGDHTARGGRGLCSGQCDPPQKCKILHPLPRAILSRPGHRRGVQSGAPPTPPPWRAEQCSARSHAATRTQRVKANPTTACTTGSKHACIATLAPQRPRRQITLEVPISIISRVRRGMCQ